MTWVTDMAIVCIGFGAAVFILERFVFAMSVVRDIKREQFELRRDLKAALSEIKKCRDSHAGAQEQIKMLGLVSQAHQDELDRLFEHTGARREINRF